MSKLKKGFTLVEMLVVIGIIAVLSGALVVGFSKMSKTARRAKDVELVSSVAAALEHIYQKNNGRWPKEILSGRSAARLDENVCKAFVRFGVLGLSYDEKTYNSGNGTVRLTGKNAKGLLNVKGESYIGNDGQVKGIGDITKYQIRYAIDEDGDGFTEVKPEGSKAVKVRAVAVAYSAGEDGEIDLTKRGRTDDVVSWQSSQEEN